MLFMGHFFGQYQSHYQLVLKESFINHLIILPFSNMLFMGHFFGQYQSHYQLVLKESFINHLIILPFSNINLN